MKRTWRGRKGLEELFRSGEVVPVRGGLTVSDREVLADETGRAVGAFMGYAEGAFEELGGKVTLRKEFRAPDRLTIRAVNGFGVEGPATICRATHRRS